MADLTSIFPPPNPQKVSSVRGASNILAINIAGAQQSGAENLNVVSVTQLQLALAERQLNDVVYQKLTMDPNDENYIRYMRGDICELGDALSNAVRDIIGYTAEGQMEELFALAATKKI